jgi:DNA-binding XRE family transcriptional regulator
MARTLAEVKASLDPDRRARIEAASAVAIAEIENLRELRRLVAMSQEQMAESLGVSQPSIHQVEKRTDLYLSTLRRFVQAAGGELELIVRLPNREPLRLKGIGELTG